MDCVVWYAVESIHRRKRRVIATGSGQLVNISSGGALFTTEKCLEVGQRVKLAIGWPAQRNNMTPLELVVHGPVVRCDETHAAIAIEHSRFRTLSTSGL